MAGQDDFQERLKRLGHDTSNPAPKPSPRSAPRKSHRGTNGGGSANIVILAAIGAAALWVGYSVLQYVNRENPMHEMASAYLAEEEPPAFSTIKGLFGQNENDNIYTRSCISFLPSAPDGWVRVTAWDTRYPQLMPRLEGVWQASDKSLEAAPGYTELEAFVTYWGAEGRPKTHRAGKTRLSSAIYMNVAKGTYLKLDVESTPWRETKTCTQEFLRQWQTFEAADKPRYPVLNQFGWSEMVYSPGRVPNALRGTGAKGISATKRVSPGLSLSVSGYANAGDLWEVLNGDDIPEKVIRAMAKASS